MVNFTTVRNKLPQHLNSRQYTDPNVHICLTFCHAVNNGALWTAIYNETGTPISILIAIFSSFTVNEYLTVSHWKKRDHNRFEWNDVSQLCAIYLHQRQPDAFPE